LRDYDIQVDGLDETNALRSYVKQKPNKRILGVPLYLHFYNWKNPKKEKGFRNWVSSNGEAPVITDTITANRTALQLEKYYFNRGYFQAQSHFQIQCRNKKSVVHYSVIKGPAYVLRNIELTHNSPGLDSLLKAEFKNSILQTGKVYNVEDLDRERSRLTSVFRNNGFYDFTKEYIYFEIDSSIHGPYVDILMGVENKRVQSGDTLIFVPHEAYEIEQVFIVPAFNPRLKEQPKRDTVTYRELRILSHRDRYKPRFLHEGNHLQRGTLYYEREVTDTYGHYMDMGIFRKVDIEFSPIRDTTTTARKLNAYIFLQPKKRHTAGIEGEGTHSSGRFGIAGNLFYKNINTFKGGEVFDTRLRGALEMQPQQDFLNNWELGVDANLRIPRFLLPFRTENLVPSRFFPKTTFGIGYSKQIRQDFDRDLIRAAVVYSWNPNKNILHQVNLMDLSYVKLSNITDTTYINSQRIRTGYEDVFIPAISYTYIYNNQGFNVQRDYNFFRGMVEFSGNAINGLAPVLNLEQNSDGAYMIGDVPISQYVKLELDNRYFYFVGGNRRRFTVRYYGGWALAYGNSLVIPFEKQFFTGGSNDLRGWVAYTQPPGSSYNPGQTVYTGDIKLLLMTDYRFSIAGPLEGAVFVDAGNTWLMRPDESSPGADFDIKRFYKEFGIAPGLGIRYDFSYFVFRLDAGVKLYQPSLEPGSRWTFNELNFKNATWSIALGYPF
jgi:outer membrane protein assembly factor BamA